MASMVEDFSLALAASWYEGKTFSADWTSTRLPLMAELIKPYRGASARVIEVGSWEGRSALFFVNYLPDARVTCIDPFDTGIYPEFKVPSALAASGIDARVFDPDIERRFDGNLAAFGDRIEKVKARSAIALPELGIDRRRFDIAYIDGSHRAADVYSDAALIWPMILQGGLVIFDDYTWVSGGGPREEPKFGIDSFLHAFEGQYEIVHFEAQIAIRKR